MAATKTLYKKGSKSSSNGSSSSKNKRAALNPIAARKVVSKKDSRPQKPIFKGCTLSITGTITNHVNDITPHESIARWFNYHGGFYEKEVSANTTHLICSVEEYKKKGAQVQRAWNFSTREKQCHIIIFDWLEDSLLGPKGMKKKRVEKGYTLDRTIARIKNGKTDHAKFRAKFEEGVRAAKELCDNKLHGVYHDADSFEYKFVLARADLRGGIARMEKYTLYLFESHAIPHTYMSGAKHSRSGRPISFYRVNCHPKPFDEAMRDFKHFFFQKTNIAWDDRLEGIKTGYDSFVYTPPVLGRPVGLLPLGYIRPELREKVETTETEGEKTEEDVVYDTDSEVDSVDEDALPSSLISIPSEGSIFEGYGYQPAIPKRRQSTINSPS